MSYSISITGHKEPNGQIESEEFEQSIIDKTKEFFNGLEGATGGSVVTGHLGTTTLTKES